MAHSSRPTGGRSSSTEGSPSLYPAALPRAQPAVASKHSSAPGQAVRRTRRPARSGLQVRGGRGGGGQRAHREVLEAGEGEGAFFVQQEPGEVHRAASRRPAKVDGKGPSCKGAAELSPPVRPPVHLPSASSARAAALARAAPPLAPAAAGGAGQAGASSCSAPGGAPDAGIGARGSGLGAPGSQAGSLTSNSGEETWPRGCACGAEVAPRRASVRRSQPRGGRGVSRRHFLPPRGGARPPEAGKPRGSRRAPEPARPGGAGRGAEPSAPSPRLRGAGISWGTVPHWRRRSRADFVLM